MFELSVALKYLVPRRKQLSVSLISLLSIAVISLVVWLVLVFLSVTEGIEKTWLNKLTALNAPLRITPTSQYYSSYYYQIDAISGNSQYSLKSIAEKAQAERTDPYNPLEDGELPARFPLPDENRDHSLKDPVKGLYAALANLKKLHPDLAYQDFEISGALLRLQLLRMSMGVRKEENQGYLTQVSYLATFPDQCPNLSSLLIPPKEKDLNHLLYLSSHTTEFSRQDAPSLVSMTSRENAQSRVYQLLKNVEIQQLKPRFPLWQLPNSLLPEKIPFQGFAQFYQGKLHRIDLPVKFPQGTNCADQVKVWREGSTVFLENLKGVKEPISSSVPLLVEGSFSLDVLETMLSKNSETLFKIRANLQGVKLQGNVNLHGLEISKANFLKNKQTAPWLIQTNSTLALPINEEKESGVLLPKSFLDNGVLIGDRGYLSYSSSTSTSVQEHRLPVFVAGFYDPGILSVGNKCILVPSFVTRTINASSSSFNLDKTQSNGVLVWFDDLQSAEKIKKEIFSALTAKGLDPYWKITTFREYDFAKDLMQQFQSDKYLFALVGIIILVVACCNIISLLVLLVNDKKREIGILQAMGASKYSIAAIFGFCGITMGILSSIIGISAALFTLHNIDSIVQILSFIQGHDAFNATFFGKSLPNELSHHAVLFIVIATPTISLLAGLVPAIKACRLRPSVTLRSE
jgi:lipoprotein-releasing system permease protein